MAFDVDPLIDQLEILKSLVQSGFTLQEALRLNPQSVAVHVSEEIAHDWQTERVQILTGEIPAVSSLAAFIDRLEIERDIGESYRRSVAMPVAQSVVCAGLFIATLGLRFSLFHSAFQETDWLALILIAIAAGSQLKIYRHFTREAWVIEWIQILTSFENRIRNGKTAQHALKEITESKINPKIPPGLLKTHPDLQNSAKHRPLERAAFEAWSLIWTAFDRGITLGAFVKIQRDRLIKKIMNHYSRAALRVAFISLLPLYFLFLPACLLVILGPLLKQIQGA